MNQCPQCSNPSRRGRTFCSLTCSNKSRTKSLPDRFWPRVGNPLTDGCWEWVGQTNRNGYGVLWVLEEGKQRLAHRISWTINVGPIPNGICVLHRCDNPRCVNPEHLFLGTQTDNLDDCTSKGRRPAGERNGASKLTLSQVKEIRALRESETQDSIALRYGVSRRAIGFVLSNATWRDK